MLLRQLEEGVLRILRGANKKSWKDVQDGLNMLYEDGYVCIEIDEETKTQNCVEPICLEVQPEDIEDHEEKIDIPIKKKKNIKETKKSHYGNKSVPIGNDELGEKVSEKEIKSNIKKSKETKEAKILVRQNRVNPLKDVICECGNKFKSIVDMKELGSQCTKCMKEKIRNKYNE